MVQAQNSSQSIKTECLTMSLAARRCKGIKAELQPESAGKRRSLVNLMRAASISRLSQKHNRNRLKEI